MEKTPDYEAQKRDPRNPPSATEATTEAETAQGDANQQEGATPT